MAEMSGGCSADGDAHRNDDGRHVALEPKHKIFLSHSGAQKRFVENLCEELERCHRYPFFDLLEESLPIGESFPSHIFRAINQCYVGVVILSEEFLTSKWPMMELVAMVEEAKKRQGFKVIPVFLRISVGDLENVDNQKRWRECWRDLALKNPGRVVVEDCEAALKYIRPLNSLVKKGERDKEFLEVIVDKICGVAPMEVKLEDSHMEGRSRLCKVIQEMIESHLESTSMGVCVVGLYGMGGMGKTTLCKALCNVFFDKFRGRVCHAELERMSEEALLRDVLKRLSKTREDVLNGLNESEMRNGLKEGTFIKDPVFLAIDNMSDLRTCMKESKGYVSAKLPAGSIVLVTSRYKESLVLVMPNMDENKCMGMPKLEFEEAVSLLVKSSEGRIKDDKGLVERFVERCCFYDDGNKTSYHYHPLALEVLGRELVEVDDLEEFGVELGIVKGDIVKVTHGSDEHPIFSILRKSFDTLSKEDQLLFMDVALYLPKDLPYRSISVLEWLGMVHRLPKVEDVRKGLERLRRKSLFESIGDGSNKNTICIHDLWRAFCIAETRSGDLKVGRWVYEKGACSENSLCGMSPSGACWEYVRRMALLKFTSVELGRVNIGHFRNVTVLKIRIVKYEEGVVDLSGLAHLKSLEIRGDVHITCGLPNNLLFLFLGSQSSIHCISFTGNMGDLIELQILHCWGCSWTHGVLELGKMMALRKVVLYECDNVVSISGFLPKLQVLGIRFCVKLQSCPSVGELVLLEELRIEFCGVLKSLPSLGKLKRLRILEIWGCSLITKIKCLGALVALVELCIVGCNTLELEDMSKLRNLQVLNLRESCLITTISGFSPLSWLEELGRDFRVVNDEFGLVHLTNLQKLVMKGWDVKEIEGLENLRMLKHLDISLCEGVSKLPNFQSLIQLQYLSIAICEFMDLFALSNMIKLETLMIMSCSKLEKLPDLRRLTSLTTLEVIICPQLRHWDCPLVQQVEAELCREVVTNELVDSPSHHSMSKLEMTLKSCRLLNLACVLGFPHLEHLVIEDFPMKELPDLTTLLHLETLVVRRCKSWVGLVSHNPMNALRKLWIDDCSSLQGLEDLCGYFPRLSELCLSYCGGIRLLESRGLLTALTRLEVCYCESLTALPDLEMFPALEELDLCGCSKLGALSMAVPLKSLSRLNVDGCKNLSRDDVEHVQALCPNCSIFGLEDNPGGATSHNDSDEDNAIDDSGEDALHAYVAHEEDAQSGCCLC